jgi:predicted nucleic acid-binding protein
MKWVVIDANFGLAWAIKLPYSQQVEGCMHRWQEEKVILAAPFLWQYEVVSGLYRAVSLNLLIRTNLLPALTAIEGMAVEFVRPTAETNRLALRWAERLGQNKVYDAQYLAAAQQLSAEFWTADQRLANRAAQLKLSWVHGPAEII